MKTALFALVLLLGCGGPAPCPDVPAAPASSTEAPLAGATPCPPAPTGPLPATCAGVCTRARQLGCPWAGTTPEGSTCEHVCENVQSSGITRWNLSCRVQANGCARMDMCE